MSKKVVQVSQVQAGDVLADVVLSPAGKVLLAKDQVLTTRHICLLEAWDINKVSILCAEDDPAVTAAAAPRVAETTAYMQAAESYYSIAANAEQAFDFIRKQQLVPLPCLKDTAYDMQAALHRHGSVLGTFLLAERENDAEFISRHSIMTAFMAGMLGRRLHWTEAQNREVMLAALLHHAGNIVSGESATSHPQARIAEVAALLKKTKGISGEAVLGIIQHKEYLDGSGYPLGALGSKIHPYAKVLAVVDHFHAESYSSSKQNPFQGMHVLSGKMFDKLDPEICQTLIQQVRDHLLRTQLMLPDGRPAEIIYFYPNHSHMPIVKTADNQIVDLSQQDAAAIHRLAMA